MLLIVSAPVAGHATRMSTRAAARPGAPPVGQLGARTAYASRATLQASRRIRPSASGAGVVRASAEVVPDTSFNLAKVSFGSIGLGVGLPLLSYGFGAYFTFLPGQEISALMLIYGFPISLIGFALKYAELKPLECISYAPAVALRDSQATDIQKQVRNDVTRYRYGDEQHLDEALRRIFRVGQGGGGLQRQAVPVLTGIAETVTDGAYTLVLQFEAAGKRPLANDAWTEKLPKFQSFFGPGVTAALTFPGPPGAAHIALVCDGTGAGREGKAGTTMLPPLMPGMPAREVKTTDVK